MVRNCQLSDLIYLTAPRKVCVCARDVHGSFFFPLSFSLISLFSSAENAFDSLETSQLLRNKRRGTWSGQDEPFNEQLRESHKQL